jgi:hypothetical protein
MESLYGAAGASSKLSNIRQVTLVSVALLAGNNPTDLQLLSGLGGAN